MCVYLVVKCRSFVVPASSSRTQEAAHQEAAARAREEEQSLRRRVASLEEEREVSERAQDEMRKSFNEKVPLDHARSPHSIP